MAQHWPLSYFFGLFFSYLRGPSPGWGGVVFFHISGIQGFLVSVPGLQASKSGNSHTTNCRGKEHVTVLGAGHVSTKKDWLAWEVLMSYPRSLVAQCSATPAIAAATPPCSATPFQTQISVRHLPAQGGGCDTKIFRGCSVTPVLHLQNAIKSRKSAATRVARHV